MWIYAIIVMGAGFLSFKFNILSFKSYRIESLETRYDMKVNEKRFCQLEGIYLMIMGGTVFIAHQDISLFIILFLAILISYYLVRPRYLKLK